MADTDREARQRFAANIERLRRRDCLSLDSLAGRAGIEVRRLEAILRADEEADYGTIAQLAGALGVGPAELLEGIRWIPPRGHEPGGYAVDEEEEG
jgi:transcriptional regulator with XRE-family HTH domain